MNSYIMKVNAALFARPQRSYPCQNFGMYLLSISQHYVRDIGYYTSTSPPLDSPPLGLIFGSESTPYRWAKNVRSFIKILNFL